MISIQTCLLLLVVVCYSHYIHKGNGWCKHEGTRVGITTQEWFEGVDVRADFSADYCERMCNENSECIGYMVEDGTKCALMPGNRHGESFTSITGVDGENRNHCWTKNSADSTEGTVGGLCTKQNVAIDDVSKEICENSSETCEVYMKKGTLNGIDVVTGDDYCQAIGLVCVQMFDDENSCERAEEYASCSATGDGSSDHIVRCVHPSDLPPVENGLCTSQNVAIDDVSKEVCENSSDTCEVYFMKGSLNGIDIVTGDDYCEAIGLVCLEMFDDENGDCERGERYASCSFTGGDSSDKVVRCVNPDDERITQTKNIIEENAAGGWGGSCTCPDGSVYLVGDNFDGCDSLACFGGVSGTCNKEYGFWSGTKVSCAQEYIYKGNGWCTYRGNRVGMTTDTWFEVDVRDDFGSDNCEQMCNANPECVGYIVEGSKCGLLPGTINGEISYAISSVDGDSSTYCWAKSGHSDEEIGSPEEEQLSIIDATLSSVWFNDRFPAANCIDGDLDTMCHSHSRDESTLTLTLASNSLVSSVRLFNRKTHRQHHLNRIHGAIVNVDNELCGTVNTAERIIDINCASQLPGSSVTITVRGQYLNLMEVQVHGREDDREECSGDLVFSYCHSPCPRVCGVQQPVVCPDMCNAGCECPSGLYRTEDDRCVEQIYCPMEEEESSMDDYSFDPCYDIVCPAVSCNDGSYPPVPEGECCGDLNLCPGKPETCVDTNNGATINGYGCEIFVEYPNRCSYDSWENDIFDPEEMCCACGGGTQTDTEEPDCDTCVEAFAVAGGCECLNDETCDVEPLIPDGCYPCGSQAALHCGYDGGDDNADSESGAVAPGTPSGDSSEGQATDSTDSGSGAPAPGTPSADSSEGQATDSADSGSGAPATGTPSGGDSTQGKGTGLTGRLLRQ